MIEVNDFRNAMSMLGSAVTVITTDGEAGRCGFTASAVSSVTDEPPMLLVCMNRSSPNNESFKKNGVLCVNLLAGNHEPVSNTFARRDDDMDTRFSSADWSRIATGAPALDDALVNFDCEISDVYEAGTHSVFFCEVKGIRQSERDDGLLYYNRAYHTLGAAAV